MAARPAGPCGGPHPASCPSLPPAEFKEVLTQRTDNLKAHQASLGQPEQAWQRHASGRSFPSTCMQPRPPPLVSPPPCLQERKSMFSAAPEPSSRAPLFSQPGARGQEGGVGWHRGSADAACRLAPALPSPPASFHCVRLTPLLHPHPACRRILPAAQRAQSVGRARRAAERRRGVRAAAERRAAAVAGAGGGAAGPVPYQQGRGVAPGGRGQLRFNMLLTCQWFYMGPGGLHEPGWHACARRGRCV